MSSVTKIVGTGANVVRSGSLMNWQNVSNITTDDGNDSQTQGDLQHLGYSDYLKGTMSGNLFAIPSDQQIDGVEISFEHRMNGSSDGTQEVNSIHLLSSLGNGDDKGDDADITTETWTVRTYGGPTDKHGLALTPAVVNSSDFGFQLSIAEGSDGNGKRAQVDYFQITVYYSPIPDNQPMRMII